MGVSDQPAATVEEKERVVVVHVAKAKIQPNRLKAAGDVLVLIMQEEEAKVIRFDNSNGNVPPVLLGNMQDVSSRSRILCSHSTILPRDDTHRIT